MERHEAEWAFRKGRNSEGESFSIHYLTHGSGRILVKVFGPTGSDEFLYRVTFFCAVPDTILDANEAFDFIDAESAMAFADGILAQFDPVGKPTPKTAAAVKTAVAVTVD